MVHDISLPGVCWISLTAWWTMRQVLLGGGFRRRRRASSNLVVAKGDDGGSVLARRSFVVGHSAVAVRRQLGSLPPILGPFVRTKLAISRRSFSGFWTRMGLVVEGCCSFFLWLSVVVVHRIWW